MTGSPGGRNARPAEPHHRLRLAALSAVIIGVVLVAAATFTLSYSRIHHIALANGVAPALARLYPLMLDAAVVVACAAALALRGASWWRRVQVWLLLLLLLCLVAAGDAVDAMGIVLPRQLSRAAVAVLPWALLLLTFALWLMTLRHARRARAASAPGSGATMHAGTEHAGTDARSLAGNVYVIAGHVGAGDDSAPDRSGAGAGDTTGFAPEARAAGEGAGAAAGDAENGARAAGEGAGAAEEGAGAAEDGARAAGEGAGAAGDGAGAAGNAGAETEHQHRGREETGAAHGTEVLGTLEGMGAPGSGSPSPGPGPGPATPAPVQALPLHRLRATPTHPRSE